MKLINRYLKSNPFILQVLKISTEKIQKPASVRIVHILVHVKDLSPSNVHVKGNTLLQPLASTKGVVKGPKLTCWDPPACRKSDQID